MKNKVIGILLCLLIFTFPTLGNVTPNILLNGIAYVPSHEVLVRDDMMYLSTTDLALLTFADIQQAAPRKCTIYIGNDTINLLSDSRNIRVNNDDLVSTHAPFIQKDILYIPISVLDTIGLPYTLDKASLSIGPVTPYSRNEDDYKQHTFVDAKLNLETIPEHLISFSSEEAVNSIITSSIKDKTYLSFIDNAFLPTGSDRLREEIKRSPYNNIQVVMRKIDTLSSPQTISSFEILPMSIIPYSNYLEVTIGEDKLSYHSFWSTFVPTESLTQIDLNKSIDTTLMRIVYEYYRNKSHFKDDKFFSPFTVVTSDRTNALLHEAYTLIDGKETDYTIKVHRIHPSGSMIFLVDVYAK